MYPSLEEVGLGILGAEADVASQQDVQILITVDVTDIHLNQRPRLKAQRAFSAA